MGGEWRERPLGDLTENLDSVRIPVKEADRRAGPYPYYGASGIVDHVDGYLFDGEYLLIAEDGENLRTRQTPLAFLVRGKFWVNNHAHIVRANQQADTRFLMYVLAASDINGYLTGSTMPKLTQGNMNRIPILAPPLEDQRAIAHILGTLDDKIELNRRMSETLEAMARALFKSWFVDFNPVRAKMNLPSPSGRGVGGEGTKPIPRANAPIPTQFLDFARQLRRQATDAENLLWRLLRGRQIANAKFRRQHPFPPYILDFYCHELKLAVELDGGQHNEEVGRRRDARRDEYLAGHGIRVLRFWNNEVLGETEAVLEAIYAAVVERSGGVPSPPAPLPKGEGICGQSQSFADLFPDSFEDSDLGEIPRGWRPTYWGELVTLEYGKSLSGYNEQAGSYPVYGTNGRIGRYSAPLCKHPGVIVGRKGAYRGVHFCDEPFYVIDTAFYVEPRGGCVDLRWVYYELLRYDINSMDSGSAIPSTSREDFYSIPVLCPPFEVQQTYASLASPFWARQKQNSEESRILAALRDTLLPKLISGELRISDAESLVARYT